MSWACPAIGMLYTRKKRDLIYNLTVINLILITMSKSKKAVVQKKRFIIAKNMVGKNLKVEVTTRTGNSFTYDHDQIYELFKDKFEAMNCFNKYGNYTNSTDLPRFVKEALSKK